MQISHKLDRAILTTSEVDEALKEFVERKTQRTISGVFHFEVSGPNKTYCSANVELEDLPLTDPTVK